MLNILIKEDNTLLYNIICFQCYIYLKFINSLFEYEEKNY